MDLITLSVPFIALVCGGSLPSISGRNFTSPGYNGIRDYAKNLDCEWTLSNPNRENSSIVIHFVTFSLEHHQDCALDVLEFRVGEFNQRMCFITSLHILLIPGDSSRSQMATVSVHKLQGSVVNAKLNSVFPDRKCDLRTVGEEEFPSQVSCMDAHPNGFQLVSVLSVCSTSPWKLSLVSSDTGSHFLNLQNS